MNFASTNNEPPNKKINWEKDFDFDIIYQKYGISELRNQLIRM